MYGWGSHSGLVSISNGKANGKSFGINATDGKVVVTTKHSKNIITFIGGDINTEKCYQKGILTYSVEYGKFEKDADQHLRWRKGTQRGLHGKSWRKEKLFGQHGKCHSWYYQGRLIRQLFYYENGVKAYEYRTNSRGCTVYFPDKQKMIEIDGIVNTARIDAYPIFTKENIKNDFCKGDWSVTIYRNDGAIKIQGTYKNNQQVGKWTYPDRVIYFERGVEIPKKLYETPIEQLNAKDIIGIENTQLRSVMLNRMPRERIVEQLGGRIIHKAVQHMAGEQDKPMALIRIDAPGEPLVFLQVECVSTGTKYYLAVPPTSTKCNEALQWTYGVGHTLPGNQTLKFKYET